MANGVKFSLKLLIDEKRNKVVLAEAEQDFVDVLLSLLTLPMGRIAGLLKDHKTVLGCYKNLNKSVAEMDIRHFETDAYKSMLLDPKSSKDIHRKRLKLNMGYTYPTEFFVCPSFFWRNSCGSRAYSNFKTICSCGALMVIDVRLHVPEAVQVEPTIGDVADGVFVNCRSSFIITDDLKVTSNSISVLMNVLKDLGYNGYSDLQETLIDVGFEEVVTLLGCLFTTEATLTCTFLGKTCVTKCNEDFIDSLLTFLVHPLEMACSLSNDNTILDVLETCVEVSVERCFQNNNNLIDYAHLSMTYECLIPHDGSDRKVARKTKFIVSNDLTITPMNSSSTIGLLRKMKVDINDLEEYQTSISKAELISILRASLISSSALTNGLSNLLVKKPKKET
ncbi:hypothetical protein Bca52824_083935 [Brassica carinata]|uniref:Uncharacterized protein n=1 Tax=Brassica carinata TaxID=52824 RepID=A0A8X7TU41_BRACI|nr:hypothetical protein Bca52824_083935 [Brassica carinata]